MKIKPINMVLTDDATAEDNITSSIDGLLSRFKRDVESGKIAIDSVDKFTKVINAFILMDEFKRRNPNEKKEDFRLSDLIEDEDETVKSLYDKLFENYNTENDEKNRG